MRLAALLGLGSDLSRWLFAAVWLLTFIDFTSDYALLAMFAGVGVSTLGLDAQGASPLKDDIQSIQTLLVMVLLVLSLVRCRSGLPRSVPAVVWWFAAFFGVANLVGIASAVLHGNEWSNIIGDTRHLLLYALLFPFVGGDPAGNLRFVRFLVYASAGVLFVKMAVGQIYLLLSAGSLYSRYVMKLSCFAIIPFAVACSELLFGAGGRRGSVALIVAIVSLLVVVAAQTRGFFLGVAAVSLIISIQCVRNGQLGRVMLMTAAASVVMLGAGLAVTGDVSTALGDWGGDVYETGVDVRSIQAASMLSMLFSSPIIGIGLGGFDPGYERIDVDAIRPYILEVEMLGLLSKIGILGFASFIVGYSYLLVQSFPRTSPLRLASGEGNGRPLFFGTVIGLIGVMVVSFTNPFYTSLSFHMFGVLALVAAMAVHDLSQVFAGGVVPISARIAHVRFVNRRGLSTS